MSVFSRNYRVTYDLLSLGFDFSNLSIGGIRSMSRIKMRFTKPPFWQPQKIRVRSEENLTRENEEFTKQQIAEKYPSPLKSEILEKCIWTPRSYRCGVIARKIGVHPIWRSDGHRRLVTLLHVVDNQVIKYIPPEEMALHDYRYFWRNRFGNLAGLVVGAESADPRMFTKEYLSIFKEAGVMPKKRLTKFYITPDARLAAGTPLLAAHFRPGDFVDVHGVTMDRGFQGVMKRWNFKGMPATHGVTKSHRRGGCIGGGAGKAKVYPGKKMPGHMGRHHRMHRGVEVLRVNTAHNVIYVGGPAIPGECGNFVVLYDHMGPKNRRTEETKPPFPTFFEGDEDLEEDMWHSNYQDFRKGPIVFGDAS